MKKMVLRSKIVQMKLLIGLAAALVLIGGASAARADELIVAKVPFAFIVGDSLLPPGEYAVFDVSNDPHVVSIKSVDGKQFVFTMTIPSSFADEQAEPDLVFEQVGDQHFLARIVDGNGDGRDLLLTPSIKERELVKVAAHRGSEAVPSK
jgi:hypothetical protein